MKLVVAAAAFALSWVLAFVSVAALDTAPPRDEIEGITDKPAYRPGETVTGHWEMLYKRACDDDALRWLTTSADPYRVDYLPGEPLHPVMVAQNQMPKKVRVDFAGFQIPPDWPLGPAQYHVRDRFGCNWLQKAFPGLFAIALDRPVVEFEVVPVPAPAPGAPP